MRKRIVCAPAASRCAGPPPPTHKPSVQVRSACMQHTHTHRTLGPAVQRDLTQPRRRRRRRRDMSDADAC